MLEAIKPKRKKNLFYSYAYQDESLCMQLETHLVNLRRENVIDEWHKRRIEPGTDWKESIHAQLCRSDIILFLLSPDFMNSDYCIEVETNQALQQYREGRSKVVPILVRPIEWPASPFGHLQPIPRSLKAVSSWKNRDEAWRNIAEEIRLIVQQSRANSPIFTPETNKEENEVIQYQVVITATIDPKNRALIEAILKHLKNITDDAQMTLLEIKQGSTLLIIKGKRSGYMRLQDLIARGQLKEILGFALAEVSIITSPLVERAANLLLNHGYSVQNVLGEVSNAFVLAAHSDHLSRDVAIKIRGENFNHLTLQKEYDLFASLQDRKYTPIVYEFGTIELDKHKNYPEFLSWYSMELPKDRLDHVIDAISQNEKIKYISQFLDGLSYLHSQSIAHCDIKPHNLLITESGLKLADFGIAKSLPVDKPQHTLPYLAPEMWAQGSAEDINWLRADQYAAGITIYQILTGKSPSLTNNNSISIGMNSRRTEAVIQRMISHDPSLRYSSIALCYTDLITAMLQDGLIQNVPDL